MAKCPFARWDPLDNWCGRFSGGPYRIVHHTTEGNTYSSARGTFSAHRTYPHFTVDGATIYQHVDTSTASRALFHKNAEPATNRHSAISIELVARAATPKPLLLLTTVAKLCRWIESIHNIRQVWPSGYPKPAINGREPPGHNRDFTTWMTEGGHYGHCHVPNNIHWDPGYTADEIAIVTPHAKWWQAAYGIEAALVGPRAR